MEHKVFPKIKRLGVPETEGILSGTCIIQEKLDGANMSIWFDKEELMIGSRRQVLSKEQESQGGFSNAREYLMSLEGLLPLFGELMAEYETKDVRLYGEWLVRHTIGDYNIDAYNKFYLFDIDIDGIPIGPTVVNELANKFNICSPEIFALLDNPSREELDEYVGKTSIGVKGEGIVIKNFGFRNKFEEPQYAKIVSEKFKEENSVVFGGMQAGDTEMKIVLKFCTEGRINKIINKIEQNSGKNISMDDIKQIIHMTYHDITQEELKYIMKQGVVDFKRLQKLSGSRSAKIAIGIITNEPESVAFSSLS